MKNLTLAIVTLLLSQSLSAQTIDSLFFLNILTPFNQSIPSSEIGGAAFGSSINEPIIGQLAYAIDIFDTMTILDTMACNEVDSMFGKIALVNRGSCFFSDKAFNVEQAGAIACIICNFEDEVIDMAVGEITDINIPSIMLSSVHCQKLKDALDAGEVVELGLSRTASPTSKITGSLAHDDNLNCAVDSGENSLAEFKVTATKNNYTYTTFTNELGDYNIFVDTGDYVVTVIPPSDIWTNCSAPVDVMLPDYELEEVIDFPMESVINCPVLSVDIASPILRRCFENNFKVSYCNSGSMVAEDAFITLLLDSLFTIISSSIPYTQDDNLYTFDLGDFEYGACDAFNIVAELSCDAELGTTFCSVANIYPNENCILTSANWDGVDIKVNGSCNGSDIQFVIQNNGSDMTQSLNYNVIRNAELVDSGTFMLNSEATQVLNFPADGATYRVEANQSMDHPWANFPSATIEACTSDGEFETGFFSMFPVVDYGETYDELCQVVVGSFDPNDKQGFPNGYDDENYIDQNVDISYLIRFQNTGTDTAFTVKITDEISTHLDLSTFRVKASSHNYITDIVNQEVTFTFNNIMLPDSFINEPGSNGWLEYEISQKVDLPLETAINNTAAIFFDFNEPVITNTTLHTVGEKVLTLTSSKDLLETKPSLILSPNPIQRGQFVLIESEIDQNLTYQLLNIDGQLIESGILDSENLQIPKQIPSGIYLIRLIDPDGKMEYGKIVIH